MNRVIKNILRKPYRILRIMLRLNIYKTLRVNFALLPFNEAIRLPIAVLGKLKIDSLSGKAIFGCPVKFATVIIGKEIDNMPIETNKSRLMVKGTITFKGKSVIGHSTNIVAWPNGNIIFGKYVLIGSGVFIKSEGIVVIGDYTRFASGCFIMDTNVHAIKDAVTGKVKRICKPIEIGKYCWLAMNSSVTAGAKIPNYSISTRGAVLNCDYTESGEIGCLLAGSPAKILRSNFQRVFDLREEAKITRYFHDNPQAEYYQSKPGFETSDDIDVEVNFKI